jgi:putative phage-type endonuclease
MLQRSDDWFEARRGRFTASEIHKLLGVRGLGQTGESYIFEKAIEDVFGLDEENNFTSFDMQRGVTLEPLAFRKFKEIKEFEFLDVQETTFFSYGLDAGASPDGLVGNNAILEIKCPRPTKFFNLVAKGYDAIDKEYIAQMQMQIMCTNSEKAYFFNYIIFNGVEMWHEIEINRDEKMIDLIKERIEQAIKIKNEYKQYLITNKQF